MAEIGLFPLGIVLLPTEHVPLHIFEPRYRELIGECIEDDAEFGLVHVDDEVMAPIGTRAAVVSVLERLPDGRLNIVVEGRERFTIVAETSGRSFRTAEVAAVVDEDAPAEPTAVEQALAVYARLLQLAGAEADAPEAGDPQLSFALAGRFELAVELKLELLGMTAERDRLARVTEILTAAAAAIERQQELAARAQTNGRH